MEGEESNVHDFFQNEVIYSIAKILLTKNLLFELFDALVLKVSKDLPEDHEFEFKILIPKLKELINKRYQMLKENLQPVFQSKIETNFSDTDALLNRVAKELLFLKNNKRYKNIFSISDDEDANIAHIKKKLNFEKLWEV